MSWFINAAGSAILGAVLIMAVASILLLCSSVRN